MRRPAARRGTSRPLTLRVRTRTFTPTARIATRLRSRGYDAPREARRPGRQPLGGPPVHRRDDGGGNGTEVPLRHRELRRAAVPRPLLLRHRAPPRDRTAHGRSPPLLRSVRAVVEQLRRVPRAHDVRDADHRVDLRRSNRELLLHQRAGTHRLRRGHGRGPLAPRGATSAVVRPRSDPADLRHDQLGPRGRRARDPGVGDVRLATRRMDGGAPRARGGCQVLPRAPRYPAVPPRHPGSRAGSLGPRAVVDGRHVGHREPPVRRCRAGRVVRVLPLQLRSRGRLRQPLVHRVPARGCRVPVHGDDQRVVPDPVHRGGRVPALAQEPPRPRLPAVDARVPAAG